MNYQGFTVNPASALARGEHKLVPRWHRICDAVPLPQVIT